MGGNEGLIQNTNLSSENCKYNWWATQWKKTDKTMVTFSRHVIFIEHLEYARYCSGFQFSSVQSLSHVRLFVTPWIAACQASLSITNSQSSLRPTSIESVMPSSHLILCRPLLLLPPIPPSIRVFSSESTLRMRWPKYWSFSFSIIPSKESQGWSPSEWTGWISLQSKGLSRVFSNTTVQKHQFFEILGRTISLLRFLVVSFYLCG